ncbi:hypothetical protein FB45DRAFT_893518 [Roridomyces roridus]|uniref:THO1-MOS11 C-terminal domain-containing protein n=1 Tax=Roridomyces roridus TaxID=1738132 RepID=A0AAD7CFI3_9AGAR|nr:hypothetical protein FB45DRAFT_893518 [Roridomyces roridus]
MQENLNSSLKSLKVAELRDILASVDQPAPKATKPDLIARIVASKEATAAYNAKYAPKDDLLAPPEDLDWDNVNAPEESVEPKPTKPASKPAAEEQAKPVDPPPLTTVAPVTTPAPATNDDELEKRKKRAERFGIPLVEARPPISKKVAPPAAAKQVDVAEKLDSRASKFGTKRAAVEVDEEEESRRKRRAERFGT